jgi:hyaluronoglucosaminidase
MPHPRSAGRITISGFTVFALLVPLAVFGPAGPARALAGHVPGLPSITPRPQLVTRNGTDLVVPGKVRLRVASEADRPTKDLVVSVLRGAGARDVDVAGLDESSPESRRLTVVVGPVGDPRVAEALRAAGGRAPADLPTEGYALAATAARGGLVVLAGADSDGMYYAAQTLRQLVGEAGRRARNEREVEPGHGPARRTIAGVSIVDYPLMPLRGAIEGFYGSPWRHAERMDQLAFYGDVKMNTYVYAPKDDPYHREKWRDPYPADKLAQLGELVTQATDHHVRFTFAVSPGVSICYSDANDIRALEAKLQSIYDLGARSFSIPLDDINYTKWSCDGDRAKYGEPSRQTAAQAQVDLLNALQKQFLDAREGTRPLQMVPTEYGDVAETPYKTTIRKQLDPRIEVMWTGTDVVPPKITVADAAAAAEVWGRKVFVWDNYPVNDYDNTKGRLLLAPYAEREPGLHGRLTGIVLNPMNQAAASKVALFGGADFTWHDTGYDPEATSTAAAAYLAGGDSRTIRALLAFFDLEHLAPTFGAQPWQPQAPELARRLAAFRASWDGGDKAAALRELRPYARLLAETPEQIRRGVTDAGFVADSAPWLDALTLWGGALVITLDGLRARQDGNEDRAGQLFAEAADLAGRAAGIETIPGETRPRGPVRVGDGVLDTFLAEVPGLR